MINIKRVVILGANGTMGAGSGEVFAAGGCDVVLLARSTEKAREGLVGAQNMAKSHPHRRPHLGRHVRRRLRRGRRARPI